METYRRIQDFIRRHWYEGNWAFRVLAVAVAILLALLVLRKLRRLTVPVLIGAILVAGWLLVGPLLTIPRISSTGPVVRNGVVAVVACGKKQGMAGMGEALRHADEPRTGTWAPVQRGDCTVWYHHPPGWEQRHGRHERARREQASVDRNDFVRACGREVTVGNPAFARDLARGMRKDCGIFGPRAARTSGD